MNLQGVINFLIYGRKGKKKHDEKIKRTFDKLNEEITWKKTGPGTGNEVQRVETSRITFDICAYCGIQITNERMFEDCPRRSPDLGHTILKAKGEKVDG